MADPTDPNDLADVARDEEALFARDFEGRLIRVDAPSLADLRRTVRVRVDGSDWFDVPKAVPATDAQGVILRNADDTPVVRATTIYDAARTEAALAAGAAPPPGCPARIPVLCHRDHLPPVAVCRVCAVQVVKPDPRRPDDPSAKRVERKLLPACQHRVEDGMEVHTLWSPDEGYRRAIRAAVQVLFELLVADHYHPEHDAALRDRTGKYHNELAGPSRGEDPLDLYPAADLQAILRANWQAFPSDARTDRDRADRDRVLDAAARFAPRPYRRELRVGWVDGIGTGSRRELAQLVATPPFVVDHNNCVLCDRCIRACSDVKPFAVIGRTGKGPATAIAFDLAGVPMAESSCRACGECMTACPTGAITFQYRVLDACPDRLDELLTGGGRLAEAAVVEADKLLTMPLFARMSKAFLEWNRGAVRRREVRPGDVLAEEGEFGTTAFVLLRGDVPGGGPLVAVCRRGATPRSSIPFADEPPVATALRAIDTKKYGPPIWVNDPDPSDVLGEMSPLSYARRNATLVAVRAGSVLEIDRNVLHLLLRDPVNRQSLDRRYARRAVFEFLPRAVERSALFAALRDGDWDRRFVAHVARSLDRRPDDEPSPWGTGFLHPTASHRPLSTADLRLPSGGVELVRASPGQVVCREGEPADNFYLIRLGFVGVEIAGRAGPVVRPPLRQGDCFGEVAVLTRSWDGVEAAVGRPVRRGVRTATCTALDHVELVMIPRPVLDDFLGDPAHEVARDRLRAQCVEILSRNQR